MYNRIGGKLIQMTLLDTSVVNGTILIEPSN